MPFEIYDNSGNGKILRSDRVLEKIAGPERQVNKFDAANPPKNQTNSRLQLSLS